ncbi:MAG: hypothetical protein H0W33_12720 [Gammaproteobacteria bacterium]|nr:hypothetical protein [Gammaproteobacteria bacterium]
MTEEFDLEEERALRALFAGAVPNVADDGFSSVVVRHIRRGIRNRRLLLTLASLVGFVIASPAIAELMIATSQLLANLVSPPDGASGAGSLRLLLSMLPVREILEDVSARLMNVSDTIAWFREHQMLLIVAIPALGSLAIVRLFER